MIDKSMVKWPMGMITEEALLIQDLQSRLVSKSGVIGKLKPLQMRDLLSSPQNGIPSSGDQIGVMPDLEKIIANEFEIPIL